MAQSNLKITVVGDGAVGKTSMLMAYRKKIPNEKGYRPTSIVNYRKDLIVAEKLYSITICDTGDHEMFTSASYPQTSCFLLCYSINRRDSFENILSKWAPEVRNHMRHAPIILVGTRGDLRYTHAPNLQLITQEEGNKLAKQIAAECYIECSARRLQGLDAIITSAVRASTKNKKCRKHWNNCSTL